MLVLTHARWNDDSGASTRTVRVECSSERSAVAQSVPSHRCRNGSRRADASFAEQNDPVGMVRTVMAETKPGRLDQSRSCRFLKVATHPFRALGGLRVKKWVIWSRQNGNLS